MGFFGLFGSESSSSSTAANVTADMRTATGDISGQASTPGSVLSNPMSQGIVAGGQSKVTQTFSGPLNLGLAGGDVNTLIATLSGQEVSTVKTLADLQATSSQQAASTIGALTDVVAAAKGEGTTASRYLPYAALAASVVLLWLFMRKSKR